MITTTEAVDTIEEAARLGLSGAEFLATLGPSNVARACNGIGPESMKRKWREALNKWLWLFVLPSRVHDCIFTYDNDGTDSKFRAANDELERNCLIMANAEYRWFNPLRYLWRHRARVVAEACRIGGWDSWREAYATAKEQGIVSCSKDFRAGARNAGRKPSCKTRSGCG